MEETIKNTDVNTALEIDIAEEIIEKTNEELEAEQNSAIAKLAKLCEENGPIDPELFTKYNVNRGLRDADGNGVLTGLTEISDVQSGRPLPGKTQYRKGRLFYRGIDINDLVNGFVSEERFGFEEVTYLLLFGDLPTENRLEEFKKLLGNYRTLPKNFVRDVIMKAPSEDMMNTLARSILTLYSYDKSADDTSIENVLRQSLRLIAIFPMLAVYGYQAYVHKYDGSSLVIHTRGRNYPPLKIFYTYCARQPIHELEAPFWIGFGAPCRTRRGNNSHSPAGWSARPGRTRTPPSRRRSAV